MKKLLAVLIAIIMIAAVFAGCGKGGNDDGSTGKAVDAKGGKVFYLSFKPEADQAWQDIAKTYTKLTGTQVVVKTAASGEYENTLTADMEKDAAPTMFQVGNQAGVEAWGKYCMDLKDADFVKELTTKDFNLYDKDGKLCSVGYCYEAFGIIVNKELLEKAGHKLEDIKNFETLKKVAEDIHARSGELGFDAFTSSGLDASSSWRFSGHLANMPLFYEFRDDNVKAQPEKIKGTYLDNYKMIWDLYTANTAMKGAELAKATGDMAEAEFGQGKAVFYQNGSWEYANLTGKFGMKKENLAMIPIYTGVKGEEKAGLCCGTENCWAVNDKAKDEDKAATLKFINWLVTSEEGTKMLAEQFGPCPFKKAKTPENVFFAQANEYTSNGNYIVTWAFNYTPNVDDWRAGVVDALTQYSSGVGSWDNVKTAFVKGWETQYKAEHAA